MVITIVDDEQTVHTFTNPSLEIVAAIMHALSGVTDDKYSSETGACMCRSFSQVRGPGVPVTNWQCGECKHAAHNTRVFCGALR